MDVHVSSEVRTVSDEPIEGVIVSLFADHRRRLVGLAYIVLGDRELAEECVQEAFVRTHEAGRRLRDPERALAYVRAAVLNRARSQLRRLSVARRHPALAVPAAASAEDDAVTREDHREVVAALRSLPRRQRECLMLRYYLDLSEAEIAATLGVSMGSVKTHCHRGIATLAKTLETNR